MIRKPDFSTCVLKMCVFSVMVASLRVNSAAENAQVVQAPANPEDVIQRLMVDAFVYNFKTFPKNGSVGYLVQFEHWRMGNLLKTQKTQVFEVDPKEESHSFFVAFPAFPTRREVLVSPTNGSGEFREALAFKTTESREASMQYLEAVLIPQPKSGTSVILGFQLLGIAQGLKPEEELNKASTDPLSGPLESYHKLLREH